MRDNQKLDVARQLRKDSTQSEARLWEQLRNRLLENTKFRRQAPVGPYIADFLCAEKKLIVEIDGATHSTDTEVAYDHRRTTFLSENGFKVIRFQNVEISEGLDQVLTLITEALK